MQEAMKEALRLWVRGARVPHLVELVELLKVELQRQTETVPSNWSSAAP